MTRIRLIILPMLLSGLFAKEPATGQPCEYAWLPGREGIPDVNGEVLAITNWDPDGRRQSAPG